MKSKISGAKSMAGVYYAPFKINSKNWSHIPDETREWFDRLGDLLQASAQLTAQGNHLHAVACFGTLYTLIAAMEDGEEIVFGDEIGSWMIPGDEKQIDRCLHDFPRGNRHPCRIHGRGSTADPK